MNVIAEFFNVYLQSLMDSLPEERLSKLIKRLRAGRSHREFARKLRVSYNAVRSWELCESMPGIESLEKIADYSGQSIEEILAYLKGDEVNELKYQNHEIEALDDLIPRIKDLPKKDLIQLAKLIIMMIGDEF